MDPGILADSIPFIDIGPLLDRLGYSGGEASLSGGAAFVATLALNKIVSPLRYALDVVMVPLIAKIHPDIDKMLPDLPDVIKPKILDSSTKPKEKYPK